MQAHTRSNIESLSCQKIVSGTCIIQPIAGNSRSASERVIFTPEIIVEHKCELPVFQWIDSN